MSKAPPEEKRCTKCGKVKAVGEFYKASRTRDGLQYNCKACQKVHRVSHYAANRDTVKSQMRAYYEDNKAALNAKSREYQKANREQIAQYRRRWRAQNPGKKSEYNRKHRYGLTQEAYEAMLSTQGGTCAMCSATECSSGRAFAVDHDHSCCPGKTSCGSCVRGLLCTRCNLALGIVETYKDRASEYLRTRGVRRAAI